MLKKTQRALEKNNVCVCVGPVIGLFCQVAFNKEKNKKKLTASKHL